MRANPSWSSRVSIIHFFDPLAHLPAIAALGDQQVLLRAVYSRSSASAKHLADEALKALKLDSPPHVYSDDSADNLDTLLARKDIAAVIVVLPITKQPEIVLKALEAGKHVLSEKPVAKDVKTGIDLIDEYEKTYKPKGLVWRVAENFEAEPGYQRAAQVIRQGQIGDVRFFRLSAVGFTGKDSKWYKTPWRTIPDVSDVSKFASADYD